MLVISSITGLTQDEVEPPRKRQREGASTGGEAVDEEADDAEPNLDHNGNDEEERALPGNVRPGVSFWLVVNVASGLCATFAEVIKRRFVDAGFVIGDCKVFY